MSERYWLFESQGITQPAQTWNVAAWRRVNARVRATEFAGTEVTATGIPAAA